jgi:hypothetical protein
MAAGTYDFTIEQGVSIRQPLIWKDSAGDRVNLTGYSARMQIRSSYDTAVLLELSTALGTIIITPASGTITLVLSNVTTAAIDWRKARYDLELTAPNGTVTRLLEGYIYVSREITR